MSNSTASEAKRSVLKACEDGDLILTDVLLALGANIHEKNSQGNTPIIIASKHGNLPMVDLLLSKGANIRDIGEIRYTSILAASNNGHLSVVELLLSHGANVNDKEIYLSNSPILLASKNGHLAVVELLLSKGADIHDKICFAVPEHMGGLHFVLGHFFEYCVGIAGRRHRHACCVKGDSGRCCSREPCVHNGVDARKDYTDSRPIAVVSAFGTIHRLPSKFRYYIWRS